MKKIFFVKLLLILVLTFVVKVVGYSQLKILNIDDLSSDLNGQVVEVISPQVLLGEMSILLAVVNEFNYSLSLLCERIEVDVHPGTENGVSWVVSTPYLEQGDFTNYTANINGSNLVEYISPSDTSFSFAGRFKPNNLEGCSLFEYKWIDEITNVELANLFVRFVHQTNNDCTLQNTIKNDKEVFLYPNPTANNLNIKMNFIGSFKLEVKNIVNQKLISINKEISSKEIISLDVSDLKNGIYILNISDNNNIVFSEKFKVGD